MKEGYLLRVGSFARALARQTPRSLSIRAASAMVSAAQARDVYGVVFRPGTTNIDAMPSCDIRHNPFIFGIARLFRSTRSDLS